jgi:hypothetical protein
MQAVFDTPMPSDKFSQPMFVGEVGRQAGNAVGHFLAVVSIGQLDFPLYGEELSGMGKVNLLGFYRRADDSSAFNATMLLLYPAFFLEKSDSGSAALALRNSSGWFFLIVST